MVKLVLFYLVYHFTGKKDESGQPDIVPFQILVLKTVCDYRGLITNCLLLRKEAAVRHRFAYTKN